MPDVPTTPGGRLVNADIADGIAWITLNDPARRNCVSSRISLDLAAACAECHGRSRAVHPVIAPVAIGELTPEQLADVGARQALDSGEACRHLVRREVTAAPRGQLRGIDAGRRHDPSMGHLAEPTIG